MSPRSPSMSEGEVISGDEEKAIRTHTSKAPDSKVNGSARLHHGSSSRASPHYGLTHDPNYNMRDEDRSVRESRSNARDKSRSRSPYRVDKAPRGDKRRHEDDHYSNRKGGSDTRRFKVHYEGGNDQRDSSKHSRHSDPARDGRHRTRSRSRSPYRPNRQRHDRDRSRSPYRPGKSRVEGTQQDKSREYERKSIRDPTSGAADAKQACAGER